MDLEPFALLARALSPGLVLGWLVLSSVLIILHLRDVQVGLTSFGMKKDESRRPIRHAWIIEPLMLALLFPTGAAVWHQLAGEFIPFGRAWPSAIVMGFAFALMFVVFINLQERIPIALSTLVLVFAAIPGSIFFAFAFFVMPLVVRWEWSLFGLTF